MTVKCLGCGNGPNTFNQRGRDIDSSGWCSVCAADEVAPPYTVEETDTHKSAWEENEEDEKASARMEGP